jgi:hypothetical protein
MQKFYWELLEIDLYIFKYSNEGIGIKEFELELE